MEKESYHIPRESNLPSLMLKEDEVTLQGNITDIKSKYSVIHTDNLFYPAPAKKMYSSFMLDEHYQRSIKSKSKPQGSQILKTPCT